MFQGRACKCGGLKLVYNDVARLVQEAQEREKATMAKLLADLGLKPGDKVTIAKRST